MLRSLVESVRRPFLLFALEGEFKKIAGTPGLDNQKDHILEIKEKITDFVNLGHLESLYVPIGQVDRDELYSDANLIGEAFIGPRNPFVTKSDNIAIDQFFKTAISDIYVKKTFFKDLNFPTAVQYRLVGKAHLPDTKPIPLKPVQGVK